MLRTTRIMTGMAMTLAIGSCASTPDLPPAPEGFAAVQTFSEGDRAAIAALPAPSWVEALGAEEMTGIVREAMVSNPELNAARGRYDAARARARGAFGGLLPNLELSFGRSRTEEPIPGTDDRTRADLTTGTLSSTWEVDIWGRLTARALSANANANAVEADLAAARLSVAGQAARAWVDLNAAQQLMALAREDLETRNRALDLTQRRYERGLADALALRTARSQSASARAGEAQAQESLRVASRRLQEVLGRYPDGVARAGAPIPALQPLSGAGAPADLLERRPDVLASEARLRAAGFRTHEARAALLPRLTLSARADGTGGDLGDIADVDGLITTVLAGLTAPLFQGGQLRAEARAASAEQRTAAANYVTTALAAWREVEAAISNDASLAVREAELAVAAEEAREAQALAERQYGSGVATIFELIDSYTRRIDAERGLIAVRAERMSNRINYHIALGSGAETGGLASAAAEGDNP
ncbi:MAG: efflux transporter outer membrane subunit [Hyphomonadaceae bacterium]